MVHCSLDGLKLHCCYLYITYLIKKIKNIYQGLKYATRRPPKARERVQYSPPMQRKNKDVLKYQDIKEFETPDLQ